MFEIKRTNDAKINQLPDWILKQNDTIQKIYTLAVDEYSKIVEAINSGESLSVRKRSLSRGKLSEAAGKNRTYLVPRDYPDFCNWLEKQNLELDHLYQNKPKQGKSKSASQGLKQLSKSELIERVKERDEENNKLRNNVYIEQLNHIIDSGLNDNQIRQQKRIRELEKLLQAEREKNWAIQDSNDKLNEAVIDLQNKLQQSGTKKQPTLVAVPSKEV